MSQLVTLRGSVVTNHNTSGANPWVIDLPAGIQNGDPFDIQITTNDSTKTITSGVPSSCTLVYNTTVGSGSRHWLIGVYSSSDPTMNVGGVPAISLTWAVAVGSNTCSVIITAYSSAAGHTGWGTVGTFTLRPSGVVSKAVATGSTSNPNIVKFFEKTTGQISCSVASNPGGTTINTIANVLPSSGVAGSAYSGWYDTSAGTTEFDATYGLTANTNGGGVQIPLLTSVSATPPTAAFTASSTDRVLSVDGTTSSAVLPATALTYDWDWGDSTSHGTGSTATHTYATDGTYSVKLTVTDNNSTPLTGNVTHSETVANRTQTIEWGDGTTKQPAWLWWGNGTSKQKVHAVHIVGSGVASVSALLAKSGAKVGHMGESADTGQGSMQGITNSLVRGNIGVDALMLSVQVTSDGVYFPLNDVAYLDGVVNGSGKTVGNYDNTGTSIDPRTMDWATIQATYTLGSYLTSPQPASGGTRYPFVSMDDIRKAYPNIVIFLDPKTIPVGSYPALIAWMNANGGPTKFVAKAYYNTLSWFSAARAAGYKCWGYMYEADYTANNANLTTTAGPNVDILGMEYGATAPTWSTFTHYAPSTGPNAGVTLPCYGFIAPTLAAYNLAIAGGAKGCIVSGVKEVLGT